MKQHIGAEIGCTNYKIKREIEKLSSISNLNNISGVNSNIMVFIRTSKNPVFQKDIERNFGITRATASNIISLMEKKGLIERRKIDLDARLKQLVLTDTAKLYVDDIICDLESLENKMKKGFTEGELELFISFLQRIKNNLGGE